MTLQSRLEEWWSDLTPQQRAQWLELDSGDAIPDRLRPLVASLHDAADWFKDDQQRQSVWTSAQLAYFLQARRLEMQGLQDEPAPVDRAAS
jgi:hypothetical protein